jgi:hypothetical protein
MNISAAESVQEVCIGRLPHIRKIRFHRGKSANIPSIFSAKRAETVQAVQESCGQFFPANEVELV